MHQAEVFEILFVICGQTTHAFPTFNGAANRARSHAGNVCWQLLITVHISLGNLRRICSCGTLVQLEEAKAENEGIARRFAEGVAMRAERLMKALQQADREKVRHARKWHEPASKRLQPWFEPYGDSIFSFPRSRCP